MGEIEQIRTRVDRTAARNRWAVGFNGLLYNYGWAAASAASILAGFLGEPNPFGAPTWVGPVLGVFAAIWIAIDRRLSFGERWLFHRAQHQAFAHMQDRLILLAAEPDEASRQRALSALVDDLADARATLARIPGAAAVDDPALAGGGSS